MLCLRAALESWKVLTNSFSVATKLINQNIKDVVIPGGKIYEHNSLILSPFNFDTIKHFHEWVKNHKYLELSKQICTSKDFEKKSASISAISLLSISVN